MKKSLNLLILLLVILFGSVYGQKPSTTINPIDSRYGLVDSVVVEYLDDVNVVLHSVIFNCDSITLRSTHRPVQIINDPDTVKMLINYVNALFISGKEKSIVNITYGSLFHFQPTDRITIRLFSNKSDYWTHEIFLETNTGKIEFSKKFNSFIKFFRSLIKYNQ